eukprot:5820218-Lingulodinium_polyedra.AAC.1
MRPQRVDAVGSRRRLGRCPSHVLRRAAPARALEAKLEGMPASASAVAALLWAGPARSLRSGWCARPAPARPR